MNKFLTATLLLIVLACNKENQDTVCFVLNERQCATDPYQAYIRDGNKEKDRLNGIKEYLRAQGIKDVQITANALDNGAVCLACVCPSGVNYELRLAAEDTSNLRSLKLLVTQVSCD